MNLTDYRNEISEQQRSSDLMSLVPDDCQHQALDVGARDGWFSRLLTDRFDEVTALDLEMPQIDHPKVRCVKGDATNLDFGDATFDLVFCAEVLEHIPGAYLEKVCSELQRVSRKYVIIGVPYKQDLRVDQMTCNSCGKTNPPWGHVNSFDESTLNQLFPGLVVKSTSFVGSTKARTNWLSTWLLNFAGNPYGPYGQDEPCVHCGQKLIDRPSRTLPQKLATRIAYVITGLQTSFVDARPKWIHVLFEKP